MAWEIREGDVLDRLREMPGGCVHTCITSPPYWNLRDYGTASWVGGDVECDHRHQHGGEGVASVKQNSSVGTQTLQYREDCPLCGAKRTDKQLGLEPTPEKFISNMVKLFQEVKRVLRDDATCWINMGDSYLSQQGKGFNGQKRLDDESRNNPVARPSHIKPKDLAGVPWTLALALRDDGWFLRSDIIWHKPNPMPESVTDRPTKAHEYIFLLSKRGKYYYDADAIREGSIAAGETRGARNKRDVWTVATFAYPEAHFATFPPKLIEPCILAGCPEGGTVLDPFSGSGTTGVVALRHNRNYIGIELNPEYAAMSRRRIEDDAPLLNTGTQNATD